MDITILGIGSRGDVQPLVAISLGLRAVGYDVRFATHPEFEGMVVKRGLDFFSIQVSSRELMATEVGQTAMESGSNILRSLLNFSRMIKKGALQVGTESLTACQDTKMIVYSPLGFYIAPHLAEKLNLPHIGAFLQPYHRTRTFPSCILTTHHFNGYLNLLTYLPAEALFWLPYRSAVNQFRQQMLNLSPIPIWVNQSRKWQKHSPVIYGFSPTVIPKPSDWEDRVKITGYWFLEGDANWQPPKALVDFLAADTPPVYVGFGSMSTRKPKETTEIILQALSRSGQRGLLLTGWGGMSAVELPENVFKIEAAPHDWLFPQMAAVIHHGGAGTTAAGLRAGVPTITVPHFMDQPFWGQRVADLGVGPQPIRRNELSVERLADAITEAVTDENMQSRAAKVGEQIRSEEGVARAVEVIGSQLSTLKT